MTINEIRTWFYKIAAGPGDVNAVKKDKVAQRVARRAVGHGIGKGLGKWFK